MPCRLRAYPLTVSWSPDGTSLLSSGWHTDGHTLPGGVVAVPAGQPDRSRVLIDSVDPVPDYYSHRWAAVQLWGRQPR